MEVLSNELTRIASFWSKTGGKALACLLERADWWSKTRFLVCSLPHAIVDVTYRAPSAEKDLSNMMNRHKTGRLLFKKKQTADSYWRRCWYKPLMFKLDPRSHCSKACSLALPRTFPTVKQCLGCYWPSSWRMVLMGSVQPAKLPSMKWVVEEIREHEHLQEAHVQCNTRWSGVEVIRGDHPWYPCLVYLLQHLGQRHWRKILAMENAKHAW